MFKPRKYIDEKGKEQLQNFKISMEATQKAECKHKFDKMGDAVVTADQEGKMIAYGNVRSFPDEQNSGYNVLQLSLIKLHEDYNRQDEEKLKT